MNLFWNRHSRKLDVHTKLTVYAAVVQLPWVPVSKEVHWHLLFDKPVSGHPQFGYPEWAQHGIQTNPASTHSNYGTKQDIHRVSMLCFGSLLKGGLNNHQFPIGPRCHGRVGQKMSCKFFSISTYDYIRNTCLHYIDELEPVLCHPMLWLLHDEPHPA